jgi:hypothetical protein
MAYCQKLTTSKDHIYDNEVCSGCTFELPGVEERGRSSTWLEAIHVKALGALGFANFGDYHKH